MKKTKRVLSVLLAVVMLLGAVPTFRITSQAASGIEQRLNALRSRFPQGWYWNHKVTNNSNSGDQLRARWDESFSDSVTQSPCATHNGTGAVGQYDCNFFDGGIQCFGFAGKIFYEVFGQRKSQLSQRTDKYNVMKGDYIRINNNTHSAVVLSRNGNSINVVECNLDQAGASYNCYIRWDKTYSVDSITYFMHATNYDEIDNVHSHSYTSTVTKAATCTDTGVRTYTCSCGNSYTETISALGHSFGNWTTVTIPTEQSTGTAQRTCSRCKKTESKTISKLVYNTDGWCYMDTLPDYINTSDFTIQYQNIYEKTATSSPGSDWVRGAGTTTWQNSGEPYVRYTDEATSDSKVLVKKMYFHFCGPSAGDYANYTIEGNFVHYDQVDPASVNAQYYEDDAGHSVYYLYWKSNGQQVWCQSGVTCDGAWGTHGARARGWYVENTYQNRVQVTTYKYTKTSSWSTTKDTSATTVKYRFQPKHTAHTWNNGTVTKTATCVATGIKTYACTGCSATKTETIAINPSNHVNTKNVAATASTCTVKGYTAGVYCNDCKKYISGHAEQPLAAHKTTLINAKEATYDAEGYTGDTYCTVCKQTLTKGTVISKLTKPDDPTNPTNPTNPTQPTNPAPQPQPSGGCAYCGQTHTGFPGILIGFFHSILALFGLRK
ncbi:MAG: hypothetical protein IJU56_01815 [Clostridia bacterium]|nr:hypothetical protein [Clostridia bacterium]